MPLAVKLNFRKLRETRKTKWYSQTRLAFESGISISHISDIERGQANPTLEAMERFAIAMGVKVADLYDCEVIEPVLRR